MNVKINSKKQNQLFSRQDVHAEVSDFTATPSRVEVSQVLCKELGCKEDVLVIKKIDQPFGSKSVKVEARVYDSIEAAKQERGHLNVRGKAKQEQPVGSQPKVGATSEAKAEPAPIAVPAPEAK